jgi:hypothetical protein
LEFFLSEEPDAARNTMHHSAPKETAPFIGEVLVFGEITPRHTKITKVIEVSTGKAILEDYNQFPLKECNLYFLSLNGDLVWLAERPELDAHYIRMRLNEDGRSLSAYTTGRHACEIDLKTGKLLSQLGFT